MPRYLTIFLAVLLFSVGWLLVRPKTSKPVNLIMISIDTLRADHLGTYGYSRNTSPNLDKFAKESIVFEQAIAQAASTWPSYASLFTSTYPEVHKVFHTGEDKLPPSQLTLAEALNQHNYKTAAFVGDGGLDEQYGFAQGFDTYNTLFSSAEVKSQAMEWINKNKGDKFFLFLQLYDLHLPYLTPGSFGDVFDNKYQGVLKNHDLFQLAVDGAKKVDSQAVSFLGGSPLVLSKDDLRHALAHYDQAVLALDSLLGELLKEFKKAEVYANSIIVLLSDHGDSLGELMARPFVKDAKLFAQGIVYDEVVHVPLIIRHPRFTPRRILSQVELIDVFPTLLDFLDFSLDYKSRAKIQGETLLPLIRGRQKKGKEYAYGASEVIRERTFKFVRTPSWKLIVGKNGQELYNLKEDPKETENAIDTYPKVAELLNQKLEKRHRVNLRKSRELEKGL